MFNNNLKSILAGFNKIVDKLDGLIANNHMVVTQNTQTIDQLQQSNMNLLAEAQEAQAVIDNLRKLLGSKE